MSQTYDKLNYGELPVFRRVLCTASRDWISITLLANELEKLAHEYDPPMFIHGAARGGDTMIERYCRKVGNWQTYPVPVTAQEWAHFPHTAGFRRNQKMVDAGAEVCVAFALICTKTTCTRKDTHWTHGVLDCLTRADNAGIPTRIITPEQGLFSESD